MKQFFSFLILSMLYFNAAAQRNFKPGYIVSLSGDTTKGSIDYRDWLENPQSIYFKATENEPVKQFSASSIKAFGVNGLDTFSNSLSTLKFGVNYRFGTK